MIGKSRGHARSGARTMLGRLAALIAAMTMLVAGAPVASADARSAAAPSFTDVNSTTPHADDIIWLASTGVTKGYDNGDGTAAFGGMRTVVRQDMAAFLYRLAGSPAYTPSDADRTRFRDVNAGTSHHDEIWWLASTGIAKGYDDGTFGGMRTVVRQDMAAFLSRFADKYPDKVKAKDTGDAPWFSDMTAAMPHLLEVSWLVSRHITKGYPDGTFGGYRSVVRQDMAAFLRRMTEGGDNVDKPGNGGNTGNTGNTGNNGGTTAPDVTVPWDGTDNQKVEPGKTLSLAVDGLKGATWTSSNPKAATVDQNGTVTGKGVGQSYITAKLGDKSYSCWIDIIYHYQWYFLEDYQTKGVYSGMHSMFVYARTDDPDGMMNLGMGLDSTQDDSTREASPTRAAQRSGSCLNDPASYTDIAKVAQNVSKDDPCPQFRKVPGGYVGVVLTGDTSGEKILRMYRHRDNEDYFYAPVLNITSFKVKVLDYDTAENAWIDGLIKDHTTPDMTPVQKMDAIAQYLMSDEAGFIYNPSYLDSNGERQGAYLAVGARAALQPFWIRKYWDSAVSPGALMDIAKRIGGWDSDPVSLYGKYPYGTEEWYEWHSYMEATYKGETHDWSVCPLEETGYLDSIPTLDFSDMSWMYPVTSW